MAAPPPPPPYKTRESMSRSKTSRRDTEMLADQMLRASLSRGSSATSEATLKSGSTKLASKGEHSPTSETSRMRAGPSVPVDSLVLMGVKTTHPEKAPTSSPASRRYGASLKREELSPSKQSEKYSHPKSSTTVGLTASERRLRIQNLKDAVDQAGADAPKRKIAGLFKTATSTDLLFLMDTTGSMDSYINAAKEQVKSIVNEIKSVFLYEANVRVAVVSYKDHSDSPNIEVLDFTTSTDEVRSFLDRLSAGGGGDIPEDVLGGIRTALNASWKQQTRCLIHIADAPPHGRDLHDLDDSLDLFSEPGSEPHNLTYEPLIRQLVKLNINYGLLSITSATNRMALKFSRVYIAAGADVKLLKSNTYYSDGYGKDSRSTPNPKSGSSARLQFEELELGTTYSALRRLVVKTATGSASRTAAHLSASLGDTNESRFRIGTEKTLPSYLTAIREDTNVDSGEIDADLEHVQPQWTIPGWFDETIVVEGYCPDVVVYSADTLNDMMGHDHNIRIGVTELCIHKRSKPFAQGTMRLASYARTASSSNRFVAKSFKKDGHHLQHLVEDMRCQALCKAFALQFNELVGTEHAIDFVITTCLETKKKSTPGDRLLSLEPFIEGEYVKYNSNCGWVNEELADDPFNRAAQAFSHFTFERSWGSFMVTDLQGVGRALTDPAIQTQDTERFKLCDTNLNTEGFKWFFSSHECNEICQKLKLKSNRESMIRGSHDFRERWPTIDNTACCSNKLCQKIIRVNEARKADEFPGTNWCTSCLPQLKEFTVSRICGAPGPNHEFQVSKFYFESQGLLTPTLCPDHREEDTTASTAVAMGGDLWNRMKSVNKKTSISGRVW